MPTRARFAGLSVTGVLAELVGAVVVGLLLARGGGLLGAAIGRSREPQFGDLVGAILGTFVGYILGVPLGMLGAARLLKRHGSFWLALLASILGGVLIALLAEPLGLNQPPSLLAFAIFFAAPALALIGFNLRRRG
jgi:hypothetical protein